MRLKRCTRCGQEKPLESFYRMGSARDGRKSECKDCSAARPRGERRYDRQRWNARRRARRRANRAQENASKRRYWQRHRERLCAERRIRYAIDASYRLRWRLRRAPGEARDYAAILAGDPCCYCGAPCEQIDHIEAVARGGDNGWLNLTSSCAPCNARKWAKSLLEFLLSG